MNTYLLLLRGINVGGKNKMPMAELKLFLEKHGCTDVVTYIQSGNVIVTSSLSAKALRELVEKELPRTFQLDSSLIKVLILTQKQLQQVIDKKPKGFGDKPDTYHSDVIFLIDLDAADALNVFDPKEGVDKIWPGEHVIYSQRLSAERTKSRLSKIIGTKPYQSMTIRNWNTTTKLLELLKKSERK